MAVHPERDINESVPPTQLQHSPVVNFVIQSLFNKHVSRLWLPQGEKEGGRERDGREERERGMKEERVGGMHE